MNRTQVERLVRVVVEADDGRVLLTKHAKLRDPGAGKLPLTKAQIMHVLAGGRVTEGPSPDMRVENGWKFLMTRESRSRRFCVSAVLVPDTMVLVITGFEDTGIRPLRARKPPTDGEDTE